MFFTFEGIEGSGKSTQLKRVARYLQSKGHDCLVTREPGGTPIGEKIRAILLDPASHDLKPLTELLLYTADRAQHVHEVLRPALAAGKTVLCDRYFDATIVYQGYARGLDLKLIEQLHDLLLGDFRPDLTFLLDLAPSAGLARAWAQIDSGTRTGQEIRFEEEALSFHERVRAGYLAVARKEPDRFRIIDAARNIDRVQEEILEALALLSILS